jgi:hypothetical protein
VDARATPAAAETCACLLAAPLGAVAATVLATRTSTFAFRSSTHAMAADAERACASVKGASAQSCIKCARHSGHGSVTQRASNAFTSSSACASSSVAAACSASSRRLYHPCVAHSNVGGAFDDGTEGCFWKIRGGAPLAAAAMGLGKERAKPRVNDGYSSVTHFSISRRALARLFCFLLACIFNGFGFGEGAQRAGAGG